MAVIKEEVLDIGDIKVENSDEQANSHCVPNFELVKVEKFEEDTGEADLQKRSSKNSTSTSQSQSSSSKRRTPQPKGFKLSCTYCKQLCLTERQLQRHLWEKHRKDIPDLRSKLNLAFFPACDQCDFIGVYQSQIKRHKWSHGIVDEGALHNCPKCDYKTPKKYRLDVHFNMCHSNQADDCRQQCKYCQEKFSNRNYFLDHLLNCHKNKSDKRLKKISKTRIKHCYLCDFRTIDNKKLNRHIVAKHDQEKINVLRCYNCDFETCSKSDLIQHMPKHSAKRYALDARLFEIYPAQAQEKIPHENDILQENQRKYNCKDCEFATDHKDELFSHYHETHKKKYSKVCEVCSKPTYYTAGLADHLLRYHNTEEGRNMLFSFWKKTVYSCDDCPNYQTVFVKYYKEHRFNIHKDVSYAPMPSNPRRYECVYCENQSFNYKRTLAMHILRQHGSEVSENQSKVMGSLIHWCSFCKYRTVRLKDFYRHEALCTGVAKRHS